MWKNYFLKIKNSFLELEKDFIELEDTELKGGKVKIKTEIEVLFFKPITVSIMIWTGLKKRNEENKAN